LIAGAVVAIGCALVMFAIALFIWPADRFDVLTASLVPGRA